MPLHLKAVILKFESYGDILNLHAKKKIKGRTLRATINSVGRKCSLLFAIKMQGTNRNGEGEKSLLCDPGSLRYEGERKQGRRCE